ncbi:hypothetical protein KM043_004242 [Ampulex compressa]|nr:hypothetical protein KM043_004242 [Ampulex compressa]
MTSSKRSKLLVCAAGIFVCYFYFGMLQEKITRGQYGDEKNREKFTYMFALVFFQCLVNYVFAKSILLTVMKQGEDTTPNLYYAISALTYLLGMVCSNMALQFVSYPTQVIGKAGKPIPVMILGVLLGNKVYPLKKYLFILLIVIGVALFMYKDGNEMKKQMESQMSFGELLIALSLLMDGLTSAVQERMRSEHNSRSGHMMLNMNIWMAMKLEIPISRFEISRTRDLAGPTTKSTSQKTGIVNGKYIQWPIISLSGHHLSYISLSRFAVLERKTDKTVHGNSLGRGRNQLNLS